MENNITAEDVKKIYEKIEKSKKGSFFIDKSAKKETIVTPNHVDEKIATFYEHSNEHGFDKTSIKEDGKLASRLIEGLV